MAMNSRLLLIAYALVNSALYSLLLPLWEGFDEPFHFAYVQQLANGQGVPDPRTARLSREVAGSLLLAPASLAVKQNLPQVTSYTDYFAWPARLKLEARRQLLEMPAELRWRPSAILNYEAHHPPLAYMLLVVPERLAARFPLIRRVAFLRIVASVAGSLLLLGGAERLFSQLGISYPYRTIALFCLLSCQMIWATLAHVGNDWLAVPAAVWTLVALNLLGTSPSPRAAAIAASVLAAGLLTKAYFLTFLPLLVGVCLLQRRWRELAIASLLLCGLAGPWYATNVVRYGVLSGTQEARAGVDLPAVIRTAPVMDWPFVIGSSVRASLWSGNNTFRAFSANTLNLMIGATLVALLLWAVSRHDPAEWVTFSYCALFTLALGYAAVVSYIYTHGVAHGPSPWYAQVLVAPLLGLALLGASRRPRMGRFVATLLVLVFGYVLAATYLVKLIPLYGGYEDRASPAGLAMLYGHQLKRLEANLDTTALAPAALIFALASLVTVLVVVQQVVLIRDIYPRRDSVSSPDVGAARCSTDR
jgi:hypothetical protein